MVLDTNVLVSGIVYRKSIPGRIVGAWNQGAINAVLSRHILGELARILPRFDHKLHWQPRSPYRTADLGRAACRVRRLGRVRALAAPPDRGPTAGVAAGRARRGLPVFIVRRA